MSSHTCSLCGLRYPAQSLLDLHIREDHARREDKPATPQAPAAPAAPPAPSQAPQPAAERPSWAETARRALNRMMGKEPDGQLARSVPPAADNGSRPARSE
jgi:hypothetical protein